MRQIILLASLALSLVACSTTQLASEPADLVAPGRRLSQLVELGWKISPPLTHNQVKELDPVKHLYPDNPDAVWSWFQTKSQAGDELRHVQNNAGIGFAIFRDGVFVDMTLPVVF